LAYGFVQYGARIYEIECDAEVHWVLQRFPRIIHARQLLQYAIMRGHYNVLRILLDAGYVPDRLDTMNVMYLIELQPYAKMLDLFILYDCVNYPPGPTFHVLIVKDQYPLCYRLIPYMIKHYPTYEYDDTIMYAFRCGTPEYQNLAIHIIQAGGRIADKSAIYKQLYADGNLKAIIKLFVPSALYHEIVQKYSEDGEIPLMDKIWNYVSGTSS